MYFMCIREAILKSKRDTKIRAMTACSTVVLACIISVRGKGVQTHIFTTRLLLVCTL